MNEVPLYSGCDEGFASHYFGGLIQGYLASKKHPPPYDPPRTLGMGLRQGPRGVRFLISKVSLYFGGLIALHP